MRREDPPCGRASTTTHHRARRIHRSKVNARSTPLQTSIVAVARDLEQARGALDDQGYRIFLDISRRRVGRELDRIACGDELRALRRAV